MLEAILDRLGYTWNPAWCNLGPAWGPLGPSCSPLLGHLEAFQERYQDDVDNMSFDEDVPGEIAKLGKSDTKTTSTTSHCCEDVPSEIAMLGKKFRARR